MPAFVLLQLGLPALSSVVATAEAAQVSLRPDSPRFVEGQSVGLVLTVTDTTVRGGVPRFGVPEGLTVEFESQEQQQLMLNYNLTTSTLYRYTLTALKPGEYVIPPLSLQTAGGVLHTASVALHVEARGKSTSGANELTGELSGLVQWVGQTVVYHLRFATDRQIVNGNWIPPEGKGFLMQPGVDAVNTNYTLGEGASRLSVQDLWLPLQFTQAGSVTLPGGALQAQFAVDRSRRRRPGQMEQLFPDLGMFTDVKSEVFAAPSIRVTPRSLPAAGRPADFSGLVGQFTLESYVNAGVSSPVGAATAGAPDAAVGRGPAAALHVGETVTIAVVMQGDAPISAVKLPTLVGDGFRVYDDQPVSKAIIKEGKLHAVASFKRAIVAEKPGRLVVPAVIVPVFDPVVGRYVGLATEPLVFDVVGAEASPQVSSFASGAAPIAPTTALDELLPIRPAPSLSPPWPGSWAVALLMPGGFALAMQGVRGMLARRRARAESRPQRLGFGDLSADPHERLSGLEQIFREAVAPRLGINSAAVHGEDLVRLGDLAAEAQSVYRLIERARYAEGDKSALHVLESALRALVAKLT
ncbi:MAG: hypothetical protein EXR69_06790 [Myxococcales bacterium]|nr:hypothetical protein [Myxococcales bacterium]